MTKQFIELEVFQALTERVQLMEAELETLKTKSRGGPKSEKAMTDEDAFRCKFGNLKPASHKEAAAALGLSYGQIFSCRGGYTFKHVKADWKPPVLATEEAPVEPAPKVEAPAVRVKGSQHQQHGARA